MRLAYLVSRFPVATETFILRELDAVDRELGGDVTLCSLFPADRPFVQPIAERWVPRARQGTPGRALRGLAWALVRRPRALAAVVATLVRAYRRRPGRLARVLATVPIAAFHARTLEAEQVEHVHAHWATYPAVAAWVARQLVGIPYSITAHAQDIFLDQSFLGRLMDDAAFVVTISEYNRAFLRAHGRGQTPVHIVRYGIDTQRFGYAPRQVPADGPVRAVCVAGFRDYKGHDVLIDALVLGGDALARIELHLVGDGPLRASLERQIARVGLRDRVHFHGTLTEDGVATQLRAADVFVLPSVIAPNGNQEGLPNVILEALSAGVPVVSTATAGAPELLREDATCLLVMPNDRASLAAALEHVLADPAAASRRAEAGRRLVERAYAVERAGAEMVALLRASR